MPPRSLLCFPVHLRVDPGPNEQKIDDHIQPQNNQNDRRQRAVDIRQTPEMQDVKREHTGVRKQIDYWNNKVEQAEAVEQNHGRNRTYHFVYRDL